MKRVTILAGEPEYFSQDSMAAIARLISEELKVEVEYRTPDILDDTPDFPESSFGDLAVLQDSDLLVVYTRFRVLPGGEMDSLGTYLASGRPIIGLRTSSHAFHFPEGSPFENWNDFGADVLGSPWISHHGHSSRTEVSIAGDAPGALIEGLPAKFDVRSWLYRTALAPWCRPVLFGNPIEPEDHPTPGPVAWFGEPGGRRTFYTSLGHADDLVLEPVRRLLANAARWALSDARS